MSLRPVIFFFAESQVLRVIMVLMQTKFVEVLHSAVPENDMGRYAMRVSRAEDEVIVCIYTPDLRLL